MNYGNDDLKKGPKTAYPDLGAQVSTSPVTQPIAYGHPLSSEAADRSGGNLQGSYPQAQGGDQQQQYEGYSPQGGPYQQAQGYDPHQQPQYGGYANGQPVYAVAGGVPMPMMNRRDEDEAVTILQWLLAGGICCCFFPCFVAGACYGFCCSTAKHTERVRKWACCHLLMTFIGFSIFITVLTLCILYAKDWGWTYSHDALAGCPNDWDIYRVLYAPDDDEREGTIYVVGNSQAPDIETEYRLIDFAKDHDWALVVVSPPGLGTSDRTGRTLSLVGFSFYLDKVEEKRTSFLSSALSCWELDKERRILVTISSGAKYVTPGLLALDDHNMKRWLAVMPSLDSHATVSNSKQSSLATTILGNLSSADEKWMESHFTNINKMKDAPTNQANVRDVLASMMREVEASY